MKFQNVFNFVALSTIVSFALAAPTADSSPETPWKIEEQKRDLDFTKPETWTNLVKFNTRDAAAADALATDKSIPALLRRSAGLLWGPETWFNFKLYITNPHPGYAGPKCTNCNHINVHIDKSVPPPKDWQPVLNAHVTHYNQDGKSCLYVWDSVSKKQLFDDCFDDFASAAGEAISAIKSVVDSVLDNASFIAKIAILAAIVIALGSAIAALPVVALA
jgi:hypothetical protein